MIPKQSQDMAERQHKHQEAPLAEHNFHTHDDEDSEHHEHEHPLEWAEILRISFVLVSIVASWLKLWKGFAPFDAIGLIASLIGGYPIYKEAFSNLIDRRMTMELSMTIAVGAALAIGEFFTASVIVVFVLIAEVLEGLTVGRGRKAIRNLLDFLPQDTTIRTEQGTREITTYDLKIGDAVIVKPGSRLPADGIVVIGNSFVDQSTITGESLPVEKVVGSSVYAGTMNQSGVLEIKVTRLGKDTTFGKIIEAIELAEKSRAPIQKTADKLAGYLVYFALGCALLTFMVTHDVRSTISVVIVTGACGIAAGTPLAILGAVGRTAANGAIVKGGLYIELLGQLNTVVFDKTGTLTFGQPEMVEIHPVEGVSERAVIEAAAIGERPSEHPLSKAILGKSAELSLPVVEPVNFQYFPGKGIVCMDDAVEIVVGNRILMADKGIDVSGITAVPNHLTEVLVARNGRFLGSLWIADVIRPEAKDAIIALRKMGIYTILLSGDDSAIAYEVGKELSVDKVYGELLPEQKLNCIKQLIAEGKKVAMVGDGINDAPALMQAHIGIAMGSGTDVAQESANVVLIGNNLLNLVETIKIARRCHRIIMANFTGTLLVDALGVALAASGILNPLFAAFIHVSSELAFILNSARLLPAASRNTVD